MDHSFKNAILRSCIKQAKELPKKGATFCREMKSSTKELKHFKKWPLQTAALFDKCNHVLGKARRY